MRAGDVRLPGAGKIESDGVGHVLGVSASRPLGVIEAMERIDLHAREEFAIALDGGSESTRSQFRDAKIIRSDEV